MAKDQTFDARKYFSFIVAAVTFSILILILAIASTFVESPSFRRFVDIATFFSNIFVGIGIWVLYFKVHRVIYKQHKEYLHKATIAYEKIKSMMPEGEVSRPINRIRYYRRLTVLYWCLILLNVFLASTNYPF